MRSSTYSLSTLKEAAKGLLARAKKDNPSLRNVRIVATELVVTQTGASLQIVVHAYRKGSTNTVAFSFSEAL